MDAATHNKHGDEKNGKAMQAELRDLADAGDYDAWRQDHLSDAGLKLLTA